MSRIHLRSLIAVSCVTLAVVGFAVADGGHKHGRSGNLPNRQKTAPPNPKEFDPNRQAPRFGERQNFSGREGRVFKPHFHGRDCDNPANRRSFAFDPRHEGHKGHGLIGQPAASNINPRDIRTLAFRLEYAIEIVSEEIRFGLPPTRFKQQILASSVQLEEEASHFRKSVDEGTAGDHFQGDFEKIVAGFTRLTQPLDRFHSTLLVDRAIFRVDRLLVNVAGQLQNGTLVDPTQPPTRQQPPVPPNLTPSRAAIPDEMKGIAQLSVADQATALAQKTCPVTGDLLGADGKPLKVQVGNRTVFVCCEACVDEVRANPEKFLRPKGI